MNAGLLFELAAGCSEQVLPGFGETFRDSPGPGIAPFPEGTTRVREEQLESIGSVAIEQKTRTRLGRLQGWTLRAQKYPAGSGRARAASASRATSMPCWAFHHPQKPSGATAVMVRCSTYPSRNARSPSMRCWPETTAPGLSRSRDVAFAHPAESRLLGSSQPVRSRTAPPTAPARAAESNGARWSRPELVTPAFG